MDFYVAKSYQGLEILEEPYTKNNKLYCKIKLKSGKDKEVRAYNAKEFARLYPSEVPATQKPQTLSHRVKEILGFQEGYIILLKDNGGNEKFCERSNARYHRMWGWYVVSTETVPVLPEGITAICLPWERIGNEDGTLKPEAEVIKEVRKVRAGR